MPRLYSRSGPRRRLTEFRLTQRPDPRVAVIIVTWNGRQQLRRCLDALRLQTYRDFLTVVVDNASRDGTVDLIRSEYPEVRLIENPRNVGFAAANNAGIRATTSPLVATLNNDTIPDPTWLAALVDAADGDPTLGSVASKMISARDPEVVDSCGIALDPAGIAWDLLGGYPQRLVDQPREVFGPCAGAALYRREMLDDVGLFDEDFFAYLEDVDLAWRARLRGWRSRLEPNAVVRHEHAATLGDSSPLKRSLLARNKVWTIAKNLPADGLWWRLPLIVLYDVGAVAFAVARQRDWASLRGRLSGLAGLPEALAKRRAIQRRRAASASDVARHYAPLALPWDVPRRYRHLTAPPREAATVVSAPITPNTRPSVRETLRGWALRGLGLFLPAGPRQRRRAFDRLNAKPPQVRPIRVVMLRPDHLGDGLLSRPAIELLVRSVPSVELTVVAGPWGVDALQGIPARVAVFPFPGFTRAPKDSPLSPYAQLVAFANRLRRERFDAAVLLRRDHWWGAIAIALAGIPIRAGHRIPEVAPFVTVSVPPDEHEATAMGALRVVRALVEHLGHVPVEADLTPQFAPSSAARTAARMWLDRHPGQGRARVAVHPGAGNPVKLWTIPRWAAVAAALGEEADVILTGTREEAPYLTAIQRAAGGEVDVAVDLTWDTLAALFEQLDLVVGMDSGPLHLATAVGTPTVRIYGPTDPSVWGPAGPAEQHIAVQASLPCIPCGQLDGPPCGHLVDPPCLAAVGPERVVALARSLLATRVPV